MRKPFLFLAIAILAIATWNFAGTPARSGQVPRVVVSIKPIHSLVAAVMQGIGTPELLVPGALPSALSAESVAKLGNADLIFWVGPALEKFMERSIVLRKQGAVAIALIDAPGVRLMALPTNTPSAVVVAPPRPDAKTPAKTEPPKPAPPQKAVVPPTPPPAKPSTKKVDDDSYNPDVNKSAPDEPSKDAAVPPAQKLDAKTPPGQTAQTPPGQTPPGQTPPGQVAPERKTLVIPPTEGKPARSPDDEPEDEPGEADHPKTPTAPGDPRLLGPRLDPGTHITRKPVDPKEIKREDLQVGNPDPYIWLDPRNAVALVRAIAGTLSQLDPDNARQYQRNAAALIANIESVDSEITGLVGDIDTRPFASVNQSFQYFEANYVLRPRSRVNFANLSPPAERINDARDRLRREEVTCIFYPAAFDPRAVTGLVNGIPTRAAPIDPFGADIKPGPEAYAEIIRKIADTYWECLSARRR